MRVSPMVAVAVVVVAAGAGTAIAGLPRRDETFVVDLAATSSPEETDATVGQTAPPSTVPSPDATSTTLLASAAPVPTSTTTPTAVPTPTVPSSAPPESSDSAANSDVTARPSIRLVVANGDGRFNLVGRNTDRLLALGYVSIDQEDVEVRPDATTVYYRPGFEDEAAVLIADLSTPNAIVLPLPNSPVTANDAAGDIVVVLGPDAVR